MFYQNSLGSLSMTNAGQAEELLSKLLGDREYLAAFCEGTRSIRARQWPRSDVAGHITMQSERAASAALFLEVRRGLQSVTSVWHASNRLSSLIKNRIQAEEGYTMRRYAVATIVAASFGMMVAISGASAVPGGDVALPRMVQIHGNAIQVLGNCARGWHRNRWGQCSPGCARGWYRNQWGQCRLAH